MLQVVAGRYELGRSKVHLTQSRDDEDLPNPITSVRTTVATATDVKQLRAIQERLSRSGLLPAERLADAAYVCGSNLAPSHARQIDLRARGELTEVLR